MASADYRLCDVCGCKVFYDSRLNYEFDKIEPEEFAKEEGVQRDYKLDWLGDWAVICRDCAKTKRCLIVDA